MNDKKRNKQTTTITTAKKTPKNNKNLIIDLSIKTNLTKGNQCMHYLLTELPPLERDPRLK